MKVRSLVFGLAAIMAVALAPVDFDFGALSLASHTAEAKPGSGGGGRSFGGGSRGGGWGGSGGSYSRPAPPRGNTVKPNYTVPPRTAPKAGPAPMSAAAKAQAQQASAAKLRASAATSKVQPLPKSILTQRYGKSTPSQIRSQRAAAQNRYSPEQRTVIVNRYSYRDTFDPFFMYQISMLTNVALINSFHYNHWNDYSEERRAQLLAENAQLKAELSRMEAAGTPRDPNFVPKEAGVDPSLMKTQEAVNREFGLAADDDGSHTGTTVLVLLGLVAVLSAVYLIFIRRSEAY